MTEVVYNRGKLLISQGLIVAGSTNLRAILATHASTALGAGWDEPDLNTVAELDAITNVTLKLTDRVSLASVTVTEDDTNNRVNIDCANLAFAAEAATFARGIFIYDATTDTNDTTRLLIYGSNTNFPQPLDGGLTVQINDFLRLV